jgi:hypothetical protein
MGPPDTATAPAAVLRDIYGRMDGTGKLLADNCSGFIKETLRNFKISFSDGKADALIDQIMAPASEWMYLSKGSDGASAVKAAAAGYLVLAVLKAADHVQYSMDPDTKKYTIPDHRNHGHVSVVLPRADKDGYPYLISGSIVAAGKSNGSKSVRGVWRNVDAVNVKYYRSAIVFGGLVSPNFSR